MTKALVECSKSIMAGEEQTCVVTGGTLIYVTLVSTGGHEFIVKRDGP